MFRFTIRDVLWLTVVVACLTGWWLDRRWLTAGYDRDSLIFTISLMRKEIEKLRAQISN